METLNIYKYRARNKTYVNTCRVLGEGSIQAAEHLVELNKSWVGLSKDERCVVADDFVYTLVLVDVDVNTHQGWPVRVWERERPGKQVPLRDLIDWTDWDGAAYCLARSLGILKEEDSFIDAKHIFWVSNPLGEGLDEMLMRLVGIGILQYREEPDRQFRWNFDFKVGDRK